MLNILLSALIDPDRRLRSFRRSERLASILVCIILGAQSVLYMHFFLWYWFWTLQAYLRNEYVFPGWSMAAGFKLVHLFWSSFRHDLAFLEVIPRLQPSDMSATHDWRYFILVGLCQVGINPLDHLHCRNALLHSWARKIKEGIIRGARLRECDYWVCLERIGCVSVFFMPTITCSVTLDTENFHVTLLQDFVFSPAAHF